MSDCFGKFGVRGPQCNGEACDVCSPTSKQDRAARRLELFCSYCPPNKGENSGRKPKHGAKKPRGKKS